MSAWLNTLNPEQRQGIVFALCYERVRREKQFGYRVWPEIGPEILNTPQAKTAQTVVRWLSEKGWRVAWSEVSWQGYVAFCFRELAPTTPMLGQLRNERLLRQYLKSAPLRVQVQERSRAKLEELYRSVLRPEFATTTFMARLGLLAR